MNNHEERLRFERFWVENFEPDTFDDVEYSEILNTYDSNYIVTDDLNRSWLAWQARAKPQAVPEGFVLMPKEPTDEIIEAMNEFDYRNDYSDMDGAYRTIVETLEKAQAVPEVINVGNELQSWVAVWSFKARHDHEDYIVVDANSLAEKIEKLTGANA